MWLIVDSSVDAIGLFSPAGGYPYGSESRGTSLHSSDQLVLHIRRLSLMTGFSWSLSSWYALDSARAFISPMRTEWQVSHPQFPQLIVVATVLIVTDVLLAMVMFLVWGLIFI